MKKEGEGKRSNQCYAMLTDELIEVAEWPGVEHVVCFIQSLGEERRGEEVRGEEEGRVREKGKEGKLRGWESEERRVEKAEGRREKE